jgi:hypothetical protein
MALLAEHLVHPAVHLGSVSTAEAYLFAETTAPAMIRPEVTTDVHLCDGAEFSR